MKPGHTFIRTRDAQGLPKDYSPKAHHQRGYVGIVAIVFKRRMRDTAGHMHATHNVKCVGGQV